MTARILHDHQNMENQIEKQMGCMSGFFQMFDRNQFLPGKRLSSFPADSSSQSEESPAVVPKKAVNVKPRLSLDSSTVVDGKGSLYPRQIRTHAVISSDASEEQRRSPSLVARLMGLEALPQSTTTREPFRKPDLRRSASESSSRDLLQTRLSDGMTENSFLELQRSDKKSKPDQVFFNSPWKSPQQTKTFDTQDFFPETKHKESLYGELERRLKMRGINEPAKEDLDTLKHILEALQLKGLLHAKRRFEKIHNRNFIFDRKISHQEEESPIVVMKPSKPSNLRSKPGIRRNINPSRETLLPVRRRPGRSVNESERRFSNSIPSPDRSETNATSPCSPARRKVLTGETPKRRNDPVEQRRTSPINSPRVSSRKNGSDQVSKSPRKVKKSTVEISSIEDESSSLSVSVISTTSQFDTKKTYQEEDNLLARCDKLLGSIAEITTTESQPSPVSVLDSSFYKDELSPLKHCIDLKGQSIELHEDRWSPDVSPIRLKSSDADFVYVWEIFEITKRNSKELDLFSLLEKQRYKSSSCNVSRLHRKQVFDTINEIVEKNKQLAPWMVVCGASDKLSFQQVWLEFAKARELSRAEDLLEAICGALQKDLVDESINAWGDCVREVSEMVLDVERLIFKDLIGETILDLVTFSGKSKSLVPKKLVF